MGDPTPNLAKALAKFHADPPKITRDKQNPHFKSRFTSLEHLIEATREPLAAAGLVWTAAPGGTQDEPTLEFALIHAASGEAREGSMPLLLAKRDQQALGSAITYSKRYALASVLNLAADEDDDGNAAVAPRSTGRVSASSNGGGAGRVATAKQRGLLNARASEHGLTPGQLANVILAATGNEPREFEDDQDALSFVNRALDRLPGAAVDKVLEGIAETGVPA